MGIVFDPNRKEAAALVVLFLLRFAAEQVHDFRRDEDPRERSKRTCAFVGSIWVVLAEIAKPFPAQIEVADVREIFATIGDVRVAVAGDVVFSTAPGLTLLRHFVYCACRGLIFRRSRHPKLAPSGLRQWGPAANA